MFSPIISSNFILYTTIGLGKKIFRWIKSSELSAILLEMYSSLSNIWISCLKYDRLNLFVIFYPTLKSLLKGWGFVEKSNGSLNLVFADTLNLLNAYSFLVVINIPFIRTSSPKWNLMKRDEELGDKTKDNP